jgi:hypothetical protein
MALTEAKVRGATPKERPYELSDGAGLCLVANAQAFPLWRLSFRFGASQKPSALDAFPETGLKDAKPAMTSATRPPLPSCA